MKPINLNEKEMNRSTVSESNQSVILSSKEKKETSSLIKNRSIRIHKPNSLIFTADNEVRMPRKKHLKKNFLLNNAIKTINKKTKLTHNLKVSLNFKMNKKKTKAPKKNGLNGTNKLAKKKYIKRRPKLENDQLTNSSSNDTENNTFISNENKNSTNQPKRDLNYLFSKQPVTKNGKIRGRPRKPIVIDNILEVLNSQTNGKSENNETSFKNLLEKISESHNNQILKLKKELDNREKEKIVLDIKNVSLKKENDVLRDRIANLINESELRKELEIMKKLHSQEIIEIKKKLWCSNANCGKQAIYFCCFTAFYCSLDCQNIHWFSTHKKTCRNKNRLLNKCEINSKISRKC